MVQLPETGFLRLPQIIGDPKAKPPIPAIIPICKSSWYAGIKEGRYPKPIKLSKRSSAWRVEDIRDLISEVAA
ncbi:hypothetical protein AU255_09160 [Methyloprofundus sedimenti]|uniref:Uncharacterized protein n=1 Tax=Methyloprofundus sedimenti TaxID=1420851 RepID=A0A1V8M910_9GAMM|nr:AlpA family phage regulatory protein [Methyloprofundus sedimenti]OQK18006.1 hypothetical protein AU255_09160 [Methyloprofundus sedimenti]